MKPAILLILLCACSHPSDDAAPSDLARVRAQRDQFCASFDPQSVTRCDRITFVSMMSAACGKDYNLEAYEENGKWNRDETHSCYQEGESSSECSFDGYLGVLHALRSDRGAIKRMQLHLEANGYRCGEGEPSATDISPLKSVIEYMAGQSLTGITDPFAGFRGHLLASYIWLRHEIGLKTIGDGAALSILRHEIPSSPFYAAIAGDQAAAVDRLMNFPAPYSNYWGSAPDAVIYAVSVKILDEK